MGLKVGSQLPRVWVLLTTSHPLSVWLNSSSNLLAWMLGSAGAWEFQLDFLPQGFQSGRDLAPILPSPVAGRWEKEFP
jgi:hypothetical protein